MADASIILMLGATGMLGRPVARHLVAEGFPVRALVRDSARAAALLPDGIELHDGDLRDVASIAAAMRNARAVYLNLAAPMTRRSPPFEPERDGTAAVVDAAKRNGVEHVLRISAMGVEETAPRWWVARHKLEADQAVIESGIDWTIFRPTWFMESLPSFIRGRTMMTMPLGNAPLRWLAGADYARQVAHALRSSASRNRVHHPQGPELLTLDQALQRFIAAMDERPVRVSVPLLALRALGIVHGQCHYFAHLIDQTRREFARLDRTPIPTDLPAAAMRIEDYAAYVRATGDRPTK